MVAVGGLLWRSLRVYQIWGANTDIGKTIFSTILCGAARNAHRPDKVNYLKPVSTGPADQADDRYVIKFLRKRADGKDNNKTNSACLVQYDLPVSPDIAATLSSKPVVSDSELLSAVYKYAAHCSLEPGWLFCETAGGVHSPAPSGSSQADLYRPLRAPAILIGDSKLGGISATVSAFESLRMRGYDVEAVLLFKDETYNNHIYLNSYFEKLGIPCTAIRKPPSRESEDVDDSKAMLGYFSAMERSHAIRDIVKHLATRHSQRMTQLESMSQDAHDTIWYPFTQQKLLPPENITAIDSASGDFFQTFKSDPTPSNRRKRDSPPGNLQASFDGSASWWTQGLGHANPQLTLAAAYAAGRYGHVMFAEAVHAPALQLAKMLLKGSANPRLSRVFYSDNGSTGTEVAVKMALRAARLRYGWDANEELGILGLKGSYHGDTIGAMDCSEPGVYNEKIEWYKGKGYWFDFPTVKMENGEWKVDVPEAMQDAVGPSLTIKSFASIFNFEERDKSSLARRYEAYITSTLERLQKEGKKFGALMLEPVVLGAGGMLFVDPLFQRTLISLVRRSPHLFSPGAKPPTDKENPDTNWSGLPVIFDEVFTGLYRLGHFTSATLLQSHPDISVHAKLLTGGLLPLATTLASSAIFDAFASDDKADALLHGHSYTAHAVGCNVAVESVRTMQAMDAGDAWRAFAREWADAAAEKAKPDGGETDTNTTTTAAAKKKVKPDTNTTTTPATVAPLQVWSVWSPEFVWTLSRTKNVRSVWALGSVLAVEMQDQKAEGYKSAAARELQAELAAGSGLWNGWNVHCRVLGNVLYLMTGQTTTVEVVRGMEKLVGDARALM